jgi:hypothetical protein
MHGHPKVLTTRARGNDARVAEELWTLSEKLTDVTFPI